ncbi:hypothetical protein AVEN_168263-1 [Araneus ventricosus]|uniref:Uncharacterized protein n=1 Tax=Araneus ventricosus TaxID=182803 RepID=A0A4Y2TBZ4_ARAVE|nr:hypothetical protein AVEN_168263-1 [Araneus ventricosus]
MSCRTALANKVAVLSETPYRSHSIAKITQIPCRIIKIRGDGAWFFSSLFYLVYDDVSVMAEIWADVVRHVNNNWQMFKCFTQQRSGAPHGTKRLYLTEISKIDICGTTCELMMASEILPYEF